MSWHAVSLAAIVSLTACKRTGPDTAAEPPAEAKALQQGSGLVAEADDVIAAFGAGTLGALYAKMTPGLRERVRRPELEFAASHLRDRFGRAQGIMEEKVHTEGELLWYSGLVVHATASDPDAPPGTPEARGILTPVLFQFALTPDRRFERLLVREHWFWSAVRDPADYYVPVNRFFLPGRGDWTVSHGGRTRATNKHRGSKQQRFAFDLVVKRDGRTRPVGAPKRNEAYYCHNKPLVAPASGVVVVKRDGVPENKLGARGKGGGNGIRIDHGFGEWSSLWHMVPGSVLVEEGDTVQAGQQVGRVGNSGHSSGPHIHWDVYYAPGNFGLPAEIVDSYVDARWRDRAMPVRGEVARSWPEHGSDNDRRQAQASPLVLVAG